MQQSMSSGVYAGTDLTFIPLLSASVGVCRPGHFWNSSKRMILSGAIGAIKPRKLEASVMNIIRGVSFFITNRAMTNDTMGRAEKNKASILQGSLSKSPTEIARRTLRTTARSAYVIRVS
jgi:hypothetical protein